MLAVGNKARYGHVRQGPFLRKGVDVEERHPDKEMDDENVPVDLRCKLPCATHISMGYFDSVFSGFVLE